MQFRTPLIALIVGIALLGAWLARDVGLTGIASAPTWIPQQQSSRASNSDGTLRWSPGPDHNWRENADYHWHKHGRDFPNDRSERDYIADADQFVSHPPAGAQMKQDSRGDTLIYDRGSNTFAVRAPDGSPRTMFKPHGGEAYWDRKSARE